MAIEQDAYLAGECRAAYYNGAGTSLCLCFGAVRGWPSSLMMVCAGSSFGFFSLLPPPIRTLGANSNSDSNFGLLASSGISKSRLSVRRAPTLIGAAGRALLPTNARPVGGALAGLQRRTPPNPEGFFLSIQRFCVAAFIIIVVAVALSAVVCPTDGSLASQLGWSRPGAGRRRRESCRCEEPR